MGTSVEVPLHDQYHVEQLILSKVYTWFFRKCRRVASREVDKAVTMAILFQVENVITEALQERIGNVLSYLDWRSREVKDCCNKDKLRYSVMRSLQ
jgi:hypothetical protein